MKSATSVQCQAPSHTRATGKGGQSLVDKRPGAIAQLKLQAMVNDSPRQMKLGIVQRNIQPGEADQQDWNPKHVPKRVKAWASNAPALVAAQYEITLANMASNPASPGDGALGYLNGWLHKRFGGQYCLLYETGQRADGKGAFLKVKGIGRKNGNGNDYSLDD